MVREALVRWIPTLWMLLAGGFALAQETPPVSGAPPPAPAGVASNPNPAGTPPDVIVPSSSMVDADRYIIGPRDVMQVFVWRNPELTTTIPVRPDGRISTPLVEDMVAVGKTPTQLARDVEKVLGEYIRSPQVSIIITQPASLFSQVKVVGQVGQPKPLPYTQGMTVMDALLAVGGLSPFAAGNRAKIVREEDGKTREIKVRAQDLLNKGDMSQNKDLKPGDIIVVPESFW
jgi:polysaccharide export outer membrane protein